MSEKTHVVTINIEQEVVGAENKHEAEVWVLDILRDKLKAGEKIEMDIEAMEV